MIPARREEEKRSGKGKSSRPEGAEPAQPILRGTSKEILYIKFKGGHPV